MSALEPGTWTVALPGDPIPWRRARRQGKRYFTDPEQSERQRAWKMSWRLRYGHERLPYGPIEVVGAMFLSARPASHFLTGGDLSAAGRRSLGPNLDVDNALKLVLDALNGTAYHDDKQIRVVGDVAAVWLPHSGAEGSSVLVLRELTPATLDARAAAIAERIAEARA